MKKLIVVISGLFLAVAALFGTAGIALAAPHQGNSGSDFVCPVITAESVGEHNPIAGMLPDGNYTVVPATSQANQMNVPDTATNGDGTATPGNSPAPGDPGYTAIWNGN